MTPLVFLQSGLVCRVPGFVFRMSGLIFWVPVYLQDVVMDISCHQSNISNCVDS